MSRTIRATLRALGLRAPGAGLPSDKALHPIYTSRLTGRDLIIDRRRVGFAGYLPEKAAGIRIQQTFPEIEARCSGQSVHGCSLVRMADLINAERIIIELPRPVQEMIFRRLIAAVIDIVRINEPVGLIQGDKKAGNLKRRDPIIFAQRGLTRKHAIGSRRTCIFRRCGRRHSDGVGRCAGRLYVRVNRIGGQRA